MGYNRLKRNVEQFEKATELLTVPSEYNLVDVSVKQYVLYKKDVKDKNIEENLER